MPLLCDCLCWNCCATNRSQPRCFISTTDARAIWGQDPTVAGRAWPRNPWPGSDGTTKMNASDALAPCAVGLVSGSMIFSCSMIEPGYRVTISGARRRGSDVMMILKSVHLSKNRRGACSVAAGRVRSRVGSACIISSRAPCLPGEASDRRHRGLVVAASRRGR